jgi:cytochrome c peroxidase
MELLLLRQNRHRSRESGSGRLAASGWSAFVLTSAIIFGTSAIATSGHAQNETNDAELLKDAQDTSEPLPKHAATAEAPVAPERVELGRKLFFDPRFSVDGTVSCAKCHQPALYGTDGLAKSRGAHDAINARRAPTVLNVALQFKLHWRGERETVEDQAERALTGAQSFANPDSASAAARLKAIGEYVPLFQKAFPDDADPVTQRNWGRAIGAYERTLLTPSRFDEYLAGKGEALSTAEKRGLRKFISIGCSDCHSGAPLGGGSFQKFGVESEYWKETGSKEPDKGRFDVTKDPADMYVFKVPGLRNVAMTPPYFHDGSVRTLQRAVHVMGVVQLDEHISDQDASDMVTFLKSLTGDLPAGFTDAPVLPAASFVPAPDVSGE